MMEHHHIPIDVDYVNYHFTVVSPIPRMEHLMEKLEELDLSEDELNWMLRVTAGFSQFELSLADLLEAEKNIQHNGRMLRHLLHYIEHYMLADPHCGPPYFTAAEHLTLRSLTYWAHRYPNLHRMVSLYLIMCVRKLVPFTDAEMAIKQYISDEGVHSLGTATYNRQQMRKWGAVLDMSGILTWDQTFRESAHVQGLLLNLSQHRRGLERLMTEHPPSFNYDRSPEDDYSFLEEEDDEAWLTVHVTGRVIALPKPPKPPTPTKKTAAKQPARKKVNHNAPLPPQV